MSTQIILDIFLITLMVGGIFTQLIGLLTLVYLLSPSRHPADQSNRINGMRLWWFALTRRELFVDTFGWLKRDEMDNMK